MKGQSQFYTKEIYPLVERIALLCKQANMPAFMTFQDSEDSFSTTCLNSNLSQYQRIKMHLQVENSWDIDELLQNLIHESKENGHNSLYLKAMGIPCKAPKKQIIPIRSHRD